jgi:hypothetical protein
MSRFLPYALLLVGLLPFLGKAYHIDDPVFLTIADHIRHAPTRPYDVTINWGYLKAPVSRFMGSPPLAAYYLALGRAIGPDSEWWMHLWMLPFPFLGLFALRRLGGKDPLVACLWISAPAVLVSATNLMPDLPVAVLTALGAAFFFREQFFRAGLTLLLACLVRYNAAAVLPALVFYALVKRQWRGVAAAALAGSGMLAWVLHSSEALETTRKLANVSFVLGDKLVATPVFLAAASVFPLSLLVLRLRRPEFVVAVLCAVGAGIASGLADVGHGHDPHALIGALAALGTFILVAHLLRALRVWRAEGEPLDLALWLWVAVALAIPILYLYVSVKYLAVAAAPLAVLAVRAGALPRRLAWIGVALWFLLSVSLNVADMQLAGMYRDLAESKARPGMWIAAHWGLQWYGEAKGAKAYTVRRRPVVGETIMIPKHAGRTAADFRTGLRVITLIDRIEPSSRWPLRMLNSEANAGWYSQHWGLLPYAFSTVPLERVLIVRVDETDGGPDR